MTSYLLVTNESGPIDLEAVLKRVGSGVQKLFNRNDVDVKIKNNGVFWQVSRSSKFIVRISDPELIVSEAEDLAAFSTDPEQQALIRNATTRFVCHDQTLIGHSEDLAYLFHLLGAGHESATFRLGDRQFMTDEFDEESYLATDRMPLGLDTEDGPKRTKLTRIFAEPVPMAANNKAEFVENTTKIPAKFIESFVDGLLHYGYEETTDDGDDNGSRTFNYVRNERWKLKVFVSSSEIYFSAPRPVGSSTSFEAYQTSSELVGNSALRIYDVRNDSWIEL